MGDRGVNSDGACPIQNAACNKCTFYEYPVPPIFNLLPALTLARHSLRPTALSKVFGRWPVPTCVENSQPGFDEALWQQRRDVVAVPPALASGRVFCIGHA